MKRKNESLDIVDDRDKGRKKEDNEERDNQLGIIPTSQQISSTTTDESFQECYQWLLNSMVKGLDEVEFKKSDLCQSYGCFARRDYHIGDIIFEIPQHCLYGFHLIYNSNLTKTIVTTAKRIQMENKLFPELILWLHMIEQRSYSSFPFFSYFSSLSPQSPTVDNWPIEYLQVLEGTNLASTIKNDLLEGLECLLNEIWESYREIVASIHSSARPTNIDWNANIFTISAIRWARGQYLSRRYPEKFVNIEAEALDFRNSLPDVCFGKMGVMVPLLDILNHNDEVEWLDFKIHNNCLQIICNYPVKMVTLLSEHI